MGNITFITGASGAGKTTVIKEIKKLIPEGVYSFHDFDEKGVPDNADNLWRELETKKWITEALSSSVPYLVFGLTLPSEIYKHATNKILINVVFLDASLVELEKRLHNRLKNKEAIKECKRASGKNITDFIKDSLLLSEYLKNEIKSCNGIIIETDNKHPKDVAREIVEVFK